MDEPLHPMLDDSTKEAITALRGASNLLAYHSGLINGSKSRIASLEKEVAAYKAEAKRQYEIATQNFRKTRLDMAEEIVAAIINKWPATFPDGIAPYAFLNEVLKEWYKGGKDDNIAP